MNGHVLVEVRLLRETHAAICQWACVWLLFCVDTKVVKEIMPLSEYFVVAVGMSASKHSYDLSGVVRGTVLVDDELVSVWHMLLYSNLIQVEVLSLHYHDFSRLRIDVLCQFVPLLLGQIFQEVKTVSLQYLLSAHHDKLIGLLDLLQRIDVFLWLISGSSLLSALVSIDLGGLNFQCFLVI